MLSFMDPIRGSGTIFSGAWLDGYGDIERLAPRRNGTLGRMILFSP
jgi:hypothetical protein